MKKFKFFLTLNLLFVMLSSCGAVKEGFSSQKKDEILSPLYGSPIKFLPEKNCKKLSKIKIEKEKKIEKKKNFTKFLLFLNI